MCWPARIWRKVVRATEEGEMTDQYSCCWRVDEVVLVPFVRV
jgi:hypothetical protein